MFFKMPCKGVEGQALNDDIRKVIMPKVLKQVITQGLPYLLSLKHDDLCHDDLCHDLLDDYLVIEEWEEVGGDQGDVRYAVVFCMLLSLIEGYYPDNSYIQR